MNDDFLKQCANIYFVDTPASDIKPEIYNSLRQKVMENKRQKQEKRSFWTRISLCAPSALLLVICIALPFLINNNEFYAETDLPKNVIEITEAESFIDENYPQYSFIFDDYEITLCEGYYKNNNLQLFSLSAQHKENNSIILTFNLVQSRNLIFSENKDYTSNATITPNENYTFYYKEINNINTSQVYMLLDYSQYDLYIQFNIKDQTLIDRFL